MYAFAGYLKRAEMKRLDKGNIEDIIALTPMQEGILFHYLKEPESDYYFEQLSLEISGRVDIDCFEQAWNFVIETNEMLRTEFRWEKLKSPTQIVLKDHTLTLRYHDFSNVDIGEKTGQIEEIKAKERKETFDLREVPFHVTLCKVEEDKYEMIIGNHHILYDGWSTGIILREFFTVYTDLFNKKNPVKPLKTKFKEFIKWTQNRDINKEEQFWRNYLKDFDTQIELSIKQKRKRKGKEITNTGKYQMRFEEDVCDALEDFVRKHKITIASFLYSAWGLLLQKYNYSEDVVFETTVSGRTAEIKGVENIVGLFINTLPLLVKTHAAEKISDFLLRIYEQLQYRKEYESSSTAHIRELSDLDKEILFDSVVAIENYPLDRQLMQKDGPLLVSSFSIVSTTRYDLTVLITIFDDIEVTFTYDKMLFSRGELERLSERFRRVVEFLINNPGKKVSEISILTGEEKNSPVYLMDRYQNSVPEGVLGEIYKPADAFPGGCLDESEFIENPSVPGEKLYPTGEIARKLSDGGIEILGRAANYVPINGCRIRLKDIESQLLKHQKIVDTVVIGRENEEGKTYLCAYVVSPEVLEVSELRQFLSDKLPGYMIPSFFSQLEKLPLRQNGKVDKKMLPVPGAEANAGRCIDPGDEVEQKLAVIWSELLRIDKGSIGINTDFFEAGGHSLKVTVLVSRIHKELKVKVPFIEVFKRPTIGELSQYIKETVEGKEKYVSIEPKEKKEHYLVSSSQGRIFTLQQMSPESTAYNGPFAMVLDGQLNKERLQETFRELIKRHESLRTSFELLEDRPVQKIHDEVDFEVEYFEINEEEAKEILQSFVKSFDLGSVPLFRVKLLKVEDERHILFADMHHIITDGASMEILINEFLILYEGEKLTRLKIQYKDYSEWQNSKQVIKGIKKQETYWLEKFKGEIPLLNVPSDFQGATIRGSAGSVINFEIGKKETEELRKMRLGNGVTLYMLLLAVYNILLSKYTGQQDIVIGAVISGRTHDALQNIIGVFTNFLAMRNYPVENKTFGDFLGELKHNILDAFENQDYHYEELIKRLNLQRKPGRDPLIEAAFTVQNMDIDEVKSENIRKNASLKMSPVAFDPGITKWVLDLFATEYQQTIGMTLVYSTEWFRESTARMITNHFIAILKQVLNNETIKLKDITIYNDLSFLKSKVVKEDEKDFIF